MEISTSSLDIKSRKVAGRNDDAEGSGSMAVMGWEQGVAGRGGEGEGESS
jgi:hypothetical protein